MRCVVFGGAGFLGSYLCEELLSYGHKVRVFGKRLLQNSNISHLVNRIQYITGDFTNIDDVKTALSDIDIVFHMIATTNPQTSNNNLVYDVESNVISTLNMLEEARKAKVQKVIFFSSGGTVYGSSQELPIVEEYSNNPSCSYGIHKLMIEKYLYLFKHLYGLEYYSLRIANPYGPRQNPMGGQGVIASFINKILQEKPITVWGDGSVIRDYIYVNDVAKAAVALLNYKGNQKVFNIGSGEGHSLIEIIKSIELYLGRKVEIDFKSARPLDVPVNILNISKAKQELNWLPKMSFANGIAKTIDYMKEKT